MWKANSAEQPALILGIINQGIGYQWIFAISPWSQFKIAVTPRITLRLGMAGVDFNRSPKISQNFYCQLRPRLKVELFMRRTKLSELSSWKVRRLELSSSEWVWIIQHVLLFYPNSERFRQFYIFTKRSLNSASWEQQKNLVSAFIFRNNNNIYLYPANSTIQFSNAPYN